jgi:putative phosphonate metabolism protein
VRHNAENDSMREAANMEMQHLPESAAAGNATERARSRARYGIYFAPSPDSPWWKAGCAWLGRDANTGDACAQPAIEGLPPESLASLTAAPRRYGLHATLKAPFHLAAGYGEDDLRVLAHRVAAAERPLTLAGMAVQRLRGFLALRLPDTAVAASAAVSALASRCVVAFDPLRAPPGAQEMARRRRMQLSQRQEALLQRWGYPYTEEEFCLHMTLTDRLDALPPAQAASIVDAAERAFADAAREAVMRIDALTIFRQPDVDAPFAVWQRFPFSS